MSCSKVQDNFMNGMVGNNYAFTFEYEDQAEVHVAQWMPDELQFKNVGRDTWKFQEPTVIRFTTAPNPGPFIIYRKTDLDEMEVTFYPGASIKAGDLNLNFEQLQHALQELGCFKEEFYRLLDNFIFDVRDAYTRDDQINERATPTDDKITTSNAQAARYDTYRTDFTPATLPYEQGGKRWYDTQEIQNYIWDDNIGAWIDYSRMGPAGPRGRDGHHIVIMGEHAPTKRPDGSTICNGDIWLNTCTFDAFIYYCDVDAETTDREDCNDCGDCVTLPGQPERISSCQWVTLGSSGPRGARGDDGAPGAQIWTGDNPPADPANYEFWFDTTCGDLYARYNNYWIQLNRPGRPGKDGTTKTIVRTTRPETRDDGSALQNGDIWFDSCQGTAFIYYIEPDDNGKWVELSAGGVKGQPGEDGQHGSRVWCGDRPPIAVDRYPLWFDTDCPAQLYFWCDGKWISTATPGPRGPKGDDGSGANDLNFIAPLQRVDDDIIFSWTSINALPD